MLVGKYFYYVNKFDDLIIFLIVWKILFSYYNLCIFLFYLFRVIFVFKCCLEGVLRVYVFSIDEISY